MKTMILTRATILPGAAERMRAAAARLRERTACTERGTLQARIIKSDAITAVTL